MKSNKELKAEYKQMKPLLGVFQVKNNVNGKVLIEGSANIHARWNRHQTELKFGSHRNRAFQEDWNTHGSESFVFSIVSELKFEENENLDLKKELELLEEMVLEEMNLSDEKKYN